MHSGVRKGLVVAIPIGAVMLLIALLGPGQSSRSSAPVSAVPSDSPSLHETGLASTEPVARVAKLDASTRESYAEAKARIGSSPMIRERLVEVQRLEVATQRFSDAVDEANVDVEDMNRSVVGLFESVRLEPVLSEGGMIEGLEILELEPESPFLEAGLRLGDQITQLNGIPLHDPAELPALLVRLERGMSLCVQRDAREICRTLSLD